MERGPHPRVATRLGATPEWKGNMTMERGPQRKGGCQSKLTTRQKRRHCEKLKKALPQGTVHRLKKGEL